MSEPFEDDLLSAYVDGELSADQRAQVERHLQNSPAARKKLSDFGQLAGELRALPLLELPPEFASQVMQLAERQMLLPAETAVSTPRPRAKHRRIWPWAVALGGPVAAAAGLLMMLQWIPGPHQGERVAPRESARPDPQLAQVDKVAPAELPQSAAPMARGAAGGASRSNSMAKQNVTLPTELPPAVEASSFDVSEKSGFPDDMAKDSASGKLAASRLAAPSDREIDPKFSELVEAIRRESDAGRVPVVRLFVVDRSSGMQLVQWTLDHHSIDIPDAIPATKETQGKSSDVGLHAKTGAFPEARDGLLVLAESEQLNGALHELLARRTDILGFDVARPIDVDQLDNVSREQLVAAAEPVAEEESVGMRQQFGQLPVQGVPDAVAEEHSPAKAEASLRNGRDMERRAATRLPPGRSNVQRGADGIAERTHAMSRARQLVVNVPLVDSQNSSDVKRAKKSQTARDTAPRADSVAPADERTPTGPSLVRVIFLLENSEATKPVPASPAPKPEGGA